MTTARKLWIGFGTLTALLLLSVATSSFILWQVEEQVSEMAGDARDRSAVTRELEIHLLSYGLAVRVYHEHGGLEALQDADQAVDDVEKNLSEYERMATTNRQRELAQRFASGWRHLQKLGGDLLHPRAQSPLTTDLTRFYENRRDLENLLEHDMKPDAIAVYLAHREASQRLLNTSIAFTLILVVIVLIIALTTSATVGRGVLQSEQALISSEHRSRLFIESGPQLSFMVGPDTTLQFVSPQWEEYTGWSLERVRAEGWHALIHPEDLPGLQEAIAGPMHRGEPISSEFRFRRRDGEYRWFLAWTLPMRDAEGAVSSWIGTATDIHDHRQAAQLEAYRRQLEEANIRLEALAITDGLTQLKNRRAFQEKLSAEVERAHRYAAAPLSLLLLDVDYFKQYNDTYGHSAGDEVLKRVARLLEENARSTDVVARYGGEEFAILMPSTNSEGAMDLAERCRKAIADAGWQKTPVTISVGVVTLTGGAVDGAHLVLEADKALYRSKRNGRNCVTQASLSR